MQHPPLNPPSVKNSTVKKYCHNIYRHAHCGRHSLYFGEEIKYSALTPPIRGDKAGSQGAGKALSPRGLFTNCTTTRGLLGSLGWAVAPVTQSHMQCLNYQKGCRPHPQISFLCSKHGSRLQGPCSVRRGTHILTEKSRATEIQTS